MFDDIYFGKMLKLMKTKKFRGYMTWGEAHLAVGLPRCYSKSTSVLSYSNDIVTILPKGDNKKFCFRIFKCFGKVSTKLFS